MLMMSWSRGPTLSLYHLSQELWQTPATLPGLTSGDLNTNIPSVPQCKTSTQVVDEPRGAVSPGEEGQEGGLSVGDETGV